MATEISTTNGGASAGVGESTGDTDAVLYGGRALSVLLSTVNVKVCRVSLKRQKNG